jgi:hypothetical protein
MASSSENEKAGAIEDQAPLRKIGDSTDRIDSSASTLPDEFDHRGIRLPARTRVGGIIIPQ